LALGAKEKGIPKSIGLVGNAAEIHPEIVGRGIVPDLVTDQTSAHDALNGYVPAGMTLDEASNFGGKIRKPISVELWNPWLFMYGNAGISEEGIDCF